MLHACGLPFGTGRFALDPLSMRTKRCDDAIMKNVLFVCSQNKLRSPTAEQVFAENPWIEVASAGTNSDAESPLTAELVAWADMIFVMEKAHRSKVQKRFRGAPKKARIICLDIPDDYEFMDEALIQWLKARVCRHLPS